MILCELKLPDGDGVELIQWLKEQGSGTPIAILSAIPSEMVSDTIVQSESKGYLLKPVDRATLNTAVTDILGLPSSTESEQEPLLDLSNPTVIQIVDLFKKEIDLLIDTLGDESACEDAMQLYSVVLRLQGTAPTLGFEQLGKVAARAAESLAATMSSEESAPQLNALIESCKAARAA